MADTKTTALTELTAPVASDILPIVDDPAGTPVTKKITALNLGKGAIETGAGAPSSTPNHEGQVYVDTTNDAVYVATDTVSSADWDLVLLNGTTITDLTEETDPTIAGLLLALSNGKSYALNKLTTGTIGFIIDGGGSAIATGIKGDLSIDYAGTITQVTMLLDQAATMTVDIWKDTYANFPPTDADSITASAVPGTSAANKDQDSTLTGWTTSIAAGDILRFNVDANDSATRCTIILDITKTGA